MHLILTGSKGSKCLYLLYAPRSLSWVLDSSILQAGLSVRNLQSQRRQTHKLLNFVLSQNHTNFQGSIFVPAMSQSFFLLGSLWAPGPCFVPNVSHKFFLPGSHQALGPLSLASVSLLLSPRLWTVSAVPSLHFSFPTSSAFSHLCVFPWDELVSQLRLCVAQGFLC